MSTVLVTAALVFAGVLACSDSTDPADDPGPVSVDLENISVPLLAASNDRIYTLARVDSFTRALDARSLSGEVKWTTAVPACPSAVECPFAVDGSGNLYLATVDGLMSRSGSNGSLRWQLSSVMTPAIAVGTANRLYAAGRAFATPQLMHAIDARSGTVLWSSILPPGFDAISTLLDESRAMVYALGRGGVTALDTQTGAIKWITSQNCQAGSRGALGADGTIYVTCDANQLSRLIAYSQAGATLWQTSLGAAATTLSPVIDASGTVYVANTTSLTAVNNDGSVLWRLAGLFRNVTHPVIDSDRNVYISASRISNVSGRYLVVVNNGAIIETKGLFPCVGALLLNKAGRLYCAEIALLVHMQTAGNDQMSQWSQISHDASRTGRK